MTDPQAGDGALVRGLSEPRRVTDVIDARLHAYLADRDLRAVVDTLLADCAVTGAAISLVTPGVQTHPVGVGLGASRTVFDDDVCPFVEIVDNGHSLEIADLRQHPRYWRNPLVQQSRVVAFAGEPLIVDRVVLGSVSIFDSKPRVFGPDQTAVLRHQARLAGSVLELHRGAGGDGHSATAPAPDDSSNEQPIFVPAVHQATGRLMARFYLTPAEALLQLQDLARRVGRPLPDVARDVAHGGLAAFEDEPGSAVGPTADTDLVLLEGHIATSGASTVDDLPEGLA